MDLSPGVRRLRRRRLVLQGVLVGALLVVLLASALLWPRSARSALTVPTAGRAVEPTGVLSGRLAAQRVGDRVCFRVTGGAADAQLVLPAGWGAGAALDLREPGDQVVARPGDEVRVVGRPSAADRIDGCPGTERVWSVSDLRTS